MSNNTREMFIVLDFYDDEVHVLGIKNTLKEAQILMKEDFDSFNKETFSKDNWIEKTTAWSNGSESAHCYWFIKKINIPEEKKNPLDKIMRIDFEKIIGNKYILPRTVLFNSDVISEDEVHDLIFSEKEEEDDRVISGSPKQFKNVFGI